jgi:L-rhamnose mutarotase
VIAYCECEPDVETCFARFGERDVGGRWQAFMEGMVLDLTDDSGALVRYAEDWHLD